MFKKILLSIFFSLVILLQLVPKTIYAQQQPLGPWYNQAFDQWYVKVFDDTNPTEIFGERYTFAQVKWIVWSVYALIIEATSAQPGTVTCVATGDVSQCPLPPITQSTSVPLAENFNQFKNSVFLERPISFIGYTKEIFAKLSPVKEVQAQGVGYGALSVVRGLWTRARDITYILFVLIFVITSFMIMFRVKLSPQTVISVQSALPKIFIALILVTFSYAIAGLLIDLMYVVIGGIALLTQIPFDTLVNGVSFPFLGGTVSGILGNVVAYLTLLFFSMWALLVGQGGGAGFSLIAMLILIIAVIAAVFITFKILWTLLRSFALILILTIVAPLQIALGVVVPSVGFGSWFKNFISNLAVFPVTGLIFVLAYTFILQAMVNLGFTQLDPSASGTFIPTVQVVDIPGWPPLFNLGPGWSNILLIGTSFVLYAMTPKAAELIKNLMQGRPFAFGTAVGEATGVGRAIGAGGTQYAVSSREAGMSQAAGRTVRSASGDLLRRTGLIR